jgi:hypothetical protein
VIETCEALLGVTHRFGIVSRRPVRVVKARTPKTQANEDKKRREAEATFEERCRTVSEKVHALIAQGVSMQEALTRATFDDDALAGGAK